MRKFFGFALALLVALSAAQADDRKMRIVFITHGQAGDPYWNAIKNGEKEAGKDLGIDVHYEAPDVFDMAAMGKMIDAAVASRPDGIVLSIPDPDALRGPIQGAIAAGIPVVGIDSGLGSYKELGVLAYLGQEEYESGVAVGKKLKESGATHILCIHTEVGNASLDSRCRGVKDGSGVKETVLPVTITDPVDAKGRIASKLQQDKTIDSLIALGPSGAVVMLQAVEEIDAAKRLKSMATFDMTPEILDRVADGTLLFATDAQQFLMGYMPVVLIRNYRRFGVVPPVAWPTGPSFVTKATAKSVIDLSKKGYR